MHDADVAVLYTRARSNYHHVPGVDLWPETRDARLYAGDLPVVAHPPCRAWGRFKAWAKPEPHEMDLGRLAVAQVRRWGGILEHPEGSSLWKDQGLPRPGAGADSHGGMTLRIHQGHWGHRAPKSTWLYVANMPQVGIALLTSREGRPLPAHRVELMGKAERERTPIEMAHTLVAAARLCRSHHHSR